MASWSSFKIEKELVESSQSEDDRKLQTTEIEKENASEEVKKEKPQHCEKVVERSKE